jgi:hypothetical protein
VDDAIENGERGQPPITARVLEYALHCVGGLLFARTLEERQARHRRLKSELLDPFPAAKAALRAIRQLERQSIPVDIDSFIEQLKTQRDLDWLLKDQNSPVTLMTDGTVTATAFEESVGALEEWKKRWSLSRFLYSEAERLAEGKVTSSETLGRVYKQCQSDNGHGESRVETSTVRSWPKISADAFYGLTAEIVSLIEPHTEADPVALLVQMLVLFGSVIGRTAYFQAEADRHYLNLFVVLVGLTSKGRKGTSLGHVKARLSDLDDHWVQECQQSGLASGEGLIWAVRDEIKELRNIKKKGLVVDQQMVTKDRGVTDKRLLVVETEFAAPLKIASREGSILSTVIRQAWDTGNLRQLAKNSPAKSTGAHISIVGHITKDELLRYLETTEASNGYANRILWLCTRRSKMLPDGGDLGRVDFTEHVATLRARFEYAKTVGLMTRDKEAAGLWREIYPTLSEGKPGLLGAVTSRAEAQVMRLACLYALLDRTNQVGKEHLKAALALWRYCEDSAAYIFGDRLGDPVADDILDALKEACEEGLSREQIRILFSGNRSSEQIARALGSLSELGLAESESVKREGPGRPTERWKIRTEARDKRDKRGNADSETSESYGENGINVINSEFPRLSRLSRTPIQISEPEDSEDEGLGEEGCGPELHD